MMEYYLMQQEKQLILSCVNSLDAFSLKIIILIFLVQVQ
nr:MAG TPA: hypothetical protein [Caudoviricetes sp.]